MAITQFFLTPAAGKALIAKAIVQRQDVQRAMRENALLIVKGGTNTYVAREALRLIGEDLGDVGFYRGILKPRGAAASKPMLDGDVLIRAGKWIKGASIEECAEQLRLGDMLMKGANAVHLASGECGVFIGNPAYGTMAPVAQAALGRRVALLVPVGVEKRVESPISALARIANDPCCDGPRLSFVPGIAYTELDALCQLGAQEAHILSGGGVGGYEGGCTFVVRAEDSAMEAIREAVDAVADEPLFAL